MFNNPKGKQCLHNIRPVIMNIRCNPVFSKQEIGSQGEGISYFFMNGSPLFKKKTWGDEIGETTATNRRSNQGALSTYTIIIIIFCITVRLCHAILYSYPI